jgi:hypothetical protein
LLVSTSFKLRSLLVWMLAVFDCIMTVQFGQIVVGIFCARKKPNTGMYLSIIIE